MCNLSCEDLNSIATLQYYNCLKLVKSEYNSINNMSTIQENVINIQELILKFANLAKRTASEIKLLAVSKTKPVENIIDAYNAGQRHFGESYAKEAEIKIPELKEKGYKDIIWHFIGPIQSNKTKIIAEYFDVVESVDRIKIARRLSEQRPSGMPPLEVYIQVNISEEPQKSGCSFSEIDEIADCIRSTDNLILKGLMGIAENTTDSREIVSQFSKLAAKFNEMKKTDTGITELSLGMTGDMQEAIQCGSTEIRIGTAIFGAREYPEHK